MFRVAHELFEMQGLLIQGLDLLRLHLLHVCPLAELASQVVVEKLRRHRSGQGFGLGFRAGVSRSGSPGDACYCVRPRVFELVDVNHAQVRAYVPLKLETNALET
jgi:hypothetical protein